MLDKLQVNAGVASCLHAYARAVDRGDWPTVRACYTADAFDHHGAYQGDIDGFIGDLAERHAHLDRSMHVITNIMVEPLSATEAMVESYCLCYRRFRQKDEQHRQALSTVRCRYLDRMVGNADHGWKIASRLVVFEESRIDHVVDETPTAAAISTRDAQDPLWEFLRAGSAWDSRDVAQHRTDT